MTRTIVLRRLGFARGVLLVLWAGSVALAHAAATPLEQGKIELAQDNYEEAYALFVRAIASAPTSADAHYHAGVAAQSLPDAEKAKQHLSAALKRHPSHTEARAALAEVHYALKERSQASVLLEQSAKDGPLSDRLQYLKGLLLVDDGKRTQALGLFRQLRTTSQAYAQRAAYQVGLLEAAQGNGRAARQSWEDALALDPRSSIADAIRYSLPVVASTTGGSAEVVYRFERDSNVASTRSAQKDYRHVAALNLTGQTLLGQQLWLQGDYRFYKSGHNELDTFNLQGHDLGVSLSFPVAGLSLQLPYRFTWYAIDGERYVTSHTLTPNIGIGLAAKGHTLRPFLRYQNNDYADASSPNENRDGTATGGGVAYDIQGTAKSSLRFLYEHGREDTDGANWDNAYNRFEARASYPLTASLTLKGTLGYLSRDYSNINSFFLVEREDDVLTYTLGLNYAIGKHITLHADTAGTRQDSNIPLYDYDRTVYSLGAGWKF